jgi:protein required for attachment to host cells
VPGVAINDPERRFGHGRDTASVREEDDMIGLINNLWILVCDGRKALLFQNTGDRVYPKFATREVFTQELLATHEMGSDKPGTIHSSADARRSSAEPVDMHAQAEHEFLIRLVHHLDRYTTEHRIRDLVIAAPPRALGTLREALPHHLRGLVRAEIDRDYVSLPVYEIESHLAKALAE